MSTKKQLHLESLEDRRCLAPLVFESHAIVADGNEFAFRVNDYDFDGDLDLLAEDSLGGFRLFEKTTGLIDFDVLQGFDERFLQGVFADIDGDGDDDLVALADLPSANDAESTLPDLVWIEDFRIHTDPTSIQYIIQDGPVGLDDFGVFDFDGDGDPDVVSREGAGTSDPTDWRIHQNSGGTFDTAVDSGLDASYQRFWDRDGDGDLDALQIDPITGRLRVSENREGEYQRAEVLLDSDGQPIQSGEFGSFELAGVDSDGDGDIVIAGLSSSVDHSYAIVLLSQQSDGTFQRDVVLSESVESRYIGETEATLWDLDGDGDLDILAEKHAYHEISSAQMTTSDVTWFENEDGEFNTEHLIASFSEQSPTSFYHGDFDGDGDRDLLMSMDGDGIYNRRTADQTLLMYEHVDGSGTYEYVDALLNSVEEPTLSVLADLDGDGDLDVVSASSRSGYVFWSENRDGVGDFGSLQTIVEPQGLHMGPEKAIASIRTGDLDGDGDLDVIVVQEQGNAIRWVENIDRASSFGELQLVTDKPLRPTDVAIGDLDGDGDEDIVSITYQDGDLTWYRNKNGDEEFSSPRKIVDNITWTQRYTDLELVDVDTDGDLDIFVFGDTGLFLLYNNGNANFDEPLLIDDAIRYDGKLDVADIDGDGDLDVMTAGSAGMIVWYENFGVESGFGVAQDVGSYYGYGEIEMADMDGDGDYDVVLGYSRSSSLAGDQLLVGVGWFENVGSVTDMTFAPLNEIVTNPYLFLNRQPPYTIQVADIDGDGDLDILASHADRDSIEWFELVSVEDANGWQNETVPTDVDGNGVVTPADAIIVINELNNRVYSMPDGVLLETIRPVAAPHLDVNGDDVISPPDALAVINELNAATSTGEARVSPKSLLVGMPNRQTNSLESAMDDDETSQEAWFGGFWSDLG